MTPDIICSIVFGIAATVLALLGLLQSFLLRPSRGMFSFSSINLSLGSLVWDSEIDIEDHRYWYGQAPLLNHMRDIEKMDIHGWHA